MNNSSNNHIQEIITSIRREPTPFAVIWLSSFLSIFLLLMIGGFVPKSFITPSDELPPYENPDDTIPSEDTAPLSIDDRPMRIIIERVGVDSVIENPETRNVQALDTALQKGVVHYPGSGDLDDTSNIFLFGHSSHLPIVHNKAYQAFNDIEKLIEGDIIRVRSIDREYVYRVEHVRLVDAKDAWVELSDSTHMLTLSTCNTFGKKEDRYVVEALFVGSFDIENEDLTIAG